MASPERLQKEGRLFELKQQAIAVSVEIHALREQINHALDRTKPLDEVNIQELSIQMQTYQAKLKAHRELCERIKELAEDLGLPMPATDIRRKRT